MHADDFFTFSALSKGEALRHKHHFNRYCLSPNPTTASFMRPNMVIPSFPSFVLFSLFFFLIIFIPQSSSLVVISSLLLLVLLVLLFLLLLLSSSSLLPKDYIIIQRLPNFMCTCFFILQYYYCCRSLKRKNALHYGYILHLIFSLFLHLII